MGTVASATNYYAVAYSIGDTTSFANGTATFLDSAGSAGNILYTSSNYLVSGADTIGQNLNVLNGSTVYLRVYMWGAAARINTSVFTINGFIINGTATPTQATFSTTNVSICNGSSYLFNGTSYNTTGSYTYHTLNSVGADSAATLNLTVSPPATNTPVNLVGCSGVTYNGKTYKSPTTFTDTVRSTQGCDSIYNLVTISINCNPIINSFTPTTAASGDTVTITGINFTGTKAVSFGVTAATWFSVVNDTTILATVGTGTSGTVYVINASGVGSLAGFTYNTANIIKGIKANTPFLNAGTNVNAAISYGNGILQVPAYRTGSIIFGTRRAVGPVGGGFAADGATAVLDTAKAKGEYVQFAISPALGYNMNISGITIKGNGSAASATNTYVVSYAIGDSTLFNTGGETFLDSAGSAGNIVYRTVGYLASGADTTGQSIAVNDGSVIYIRIYLWNASARTSNSQFTITNFTVIGTIKADATSSITKANICFGGSYLFNGTSYTSAGTYTAHLLNGGGGDSTAILKLTVSPQAKSDTLNYINCTSVTYKNKTYTTTTSFVDTVMSSLGCDSIYYTVNVTISCTPAISSFFPMNAAISDTVTITGVNFTGATAVSFGGTPATSFWVVNDTLVQAIVGNGSTGILSVTTPNGTATATGFVYNTANIITGIKATTPFITAGKNVVAGLTYGSGMLEVPAGARRTITFGTRAARTAGFAADGAGATFDTSNAKNEYVQFAISPVSGYKLDINGITIKGNGTVASATNYYAVAYAVGDSTAFTNGTSTFLDSAGVTGNIAYRTAGYLVSGDDTTGLNIPVSNNSTLYLRVYLWNASTRANNSQFTLSTFTVYGSVVSAATSSTTDTSICAGTSFTFNGVTYDTTGSYVAHLINSEGADSAAHLNLTVKDTSASTTKDTICQGGSFTFNGTAYSKAGTYSFHLTNAVGCDSLATLILTVKDTSASTTRDTICQGGSYTFNGTAYSKAGTYSFHLTNAVGCDSLATLILTVKDTSTSTTRDTICQGGSFTFNGTAYSKAGTFSLHLLNAAGCDSLATLILTVKDTSVSTTKDSICAGSSYIFNGVSYTTAGTYTAHLQNAVGCDSVATLILSVTTPVTPTVTVSPSLSFPNIVYTATVTNGGANPTYQWYKNNVAVGTNSNTYSYVATLTMDDSVWCVVTSSIVCTTSPTVKSNVVIINPLPVSLTAFSANAVGKQGLIKWNTGNEVNTASFIIESSKDGNTFSHIGSVTAKGSGNNAYSFTDKTPLANTVYYRLKMVDKNGTYAYSKVVSCQWLVVSKQTTVYPNPAKSAVTITGEHIASVQVIDNVGRVLKTVSLKDATNPSLNVDGLQAGAYHLRIQTTDGNINKVSFIKE